MSRSPLITPDALDEGARILDARSGPGAAAAYAAKHLKSALHIDLERDLSAAGDGHPEHGGRHPLPSLDAWARTLGRLGIGPETTIVIYDDKGGANAAARAWWMLRAVGHEDVAVLDGGFDAAVAAGYPCSSDEPALDAVDAREPYPTGTSWRLPQASADRVGAALADVTMKVLDVREEARFRGEEEPIDPVAGHIPGAINHFFGRNLGTDGRFLSPVELSRIYRELLGDTKAEDLIVHCGSGVTACHTLLALEAAGLPGARLYVGSWSEWCRSDRPKA